jgi:HEAT repeat protein
VNQKVKWAIILLAAIGSLVWLRSTLQSRGRLNSPDVASPDEDRNSVSTTSAASPTPAVRGDRPLTNEEATALKDYLDKSFARLREMGVRDIPPVAQELEEAVRTGDRRAITKAFHDAVYDRTARMEEVIPALKQYLVHEDPFVRFRAAEGLYTVGDRSGYDVLLRTVESDVPAGQSDLRVASAVVLAKYRERQASDEALRLFSRLYANGETREGFTQALELFGIWPNETRNLLVVYPNAAAMREYGIYRREDLIPKIREAFVKADKLDTKNAAAWALASMTGEAQYVDFLIQTAEPAIQDKTKAQWNEMDENARAIKYLGTLRDPRAKETLERAIDSPNSQVVGYAVVNLLFNQGGSQKAVDFIVRDLQAQGTNRRLPHDLLYHVASKVADPAVRRAGEQSDRSSVFAGSWRYFSVTRKDWPIYNWIDQYVVRLNDH